MGSDALNSLGLDASEVAAIRDHARDMEAGLIVRDLEAEKKELLMWAARDAGEVQEEEEEDGEAQSDIDQIHCAPESVDNPGSVPFSVVCILHIPVSEAVLGHGPWIMPDTKVK